MDITQEYLEGKSLRELRNLAKNRKLSPSGTKEQIINRILGFKDYNASKSGDIKSTKTKSSFPLNELPPDVQGITALNLPYEDVLNLCKTNKRLSNVCQNPDFWRRKILKDFPDEVTPESLDKLKPENMRPKYEQLYGVMLKRKAKNYAKKYKEDKQWENYSKDLDNIDEQIQELKRKRREIKGKMTTVERKYKDKAAKIQKQSKFITKKISGKLPGEYDHRYFDIRVSAIEIKKLGKITFFHPEDLSGYLRRIGIINTTFSPGDLIGISNEVQKHKLPAIFFYIGKERGNFNIYGVRAKNGQISYPGRLIVDIHRQGYKIKDIPRLYKLPFDTSSLDREEKKNEIEEEKKKIGEEFDEDESDEEDYFSEDSSESSQSSDWCP